MRMSFLFLAGAILLSIIIHGCQSKDLRLSEAKKGAIKVQLDLHNSNYHLKFAMDSIKESLAEEIKLKYSKSGNVSGLLEKKGREIRAAYNNPYDFMHDFEITEKKYLDFCEQHKQDPDEFHKSIPIN